RPLYTYAGEVEGKGRDEDDFAYRRIERDYRNLLGSVIVSMVMLGGGFIYSFELNSFFEEFLYKDQVMLSKQTPYQQLVVTRWNQDIRLYIDGNLQFSTKDEYRYHEPLVHIPMALSFQHERVLILGGGDGLVARELLKYPDIQQIEVVDLDPEMTKIAMEHPVFLQINDSAFHRPNVVVHNRDAYKFVEESSDIYDVVIIDLPDPNNVSLGKLYSKQFYTLLQKRMAAGGAIITQSTSPYFAPKAFWCIHQTMESVFPQTLALRTNVPSFGPWGFNLAVQPPGKVSANDSLSVETQVVNLCQEVIFNRTDSLSLRFLTPDVLPALFRFDGDTKEIPVEINQLSNQMLIQYYEGSLSNWR
ncbi:MAG: hypothetical protein AAF206_24080, partial [Bacteroidota bacterium]